MRFLYLSVANAPLNLAPRLPMTLHYGNRSVEVLGLVDSGSTVNVLPYRVGLALGANWIAQPLTPPLTGNLARYETRALAVEASYPQLTSAGIVQLVFAWTQDETAPVIFGQMNFFLEFDICFYRSQNAFEVQPRQAT